MNLFFKLFVKVHVALFRATKGSFGSSMMGGKVLLLTTKGNKSGKERTVPLMQFDDEGKRYIIGSMGGAPTDPAWIKNLRKTPEVGIEVKGEKYQARAAILEGAERDRIFDKVKAKAPNFAEYEKKVGGARVIPVVQVTPI
jgi:deazaflavin-dependent oxidoreductase (nitroreductase family)